MRSGEEGERFLALLSESDRAQALEIITPEDGFREIADQILERWPGEAKAVWGIWTDYSKGVGMDLVEAVYPGEAYG